MYNEKMYKMKTRQRLSYINLSVGKIKFLIVIKSSVVMRILDLDPGDPDLNPCSATEDC